MKPIFDKILIANRGEIACRIIRTARRLGIKTVAVYSEADANALHVRMADEAVTIGPPAAAQSYLKIYTIIDAAKATGAQAIHPGYGFLSENPAFVEAVAAAGLIFIGPSAASIQAMGLKDAAKRLMEEAGVPVVPGYHGDNQDAAFLAEKADEIGYPVLIKARAGGGGKGMRRVDDPADFSEALLSAQNEGKSAFGDAHVLIEKYIASPRHIEVQVFGDNHGNVVHLFERDCSLQRRHQKVIEEAPAPGMSEAVRAAMTEAAVTAARAINYSGAGTIEFIADGSDGLKTDGFWFMEMNTRLQVEHPVTEAITGFDLVEWQLRVAAGEPLPYPQDDISFIGHAFEARLYAEDAPNDFRPATGQLAGFKLAGNARIDSGVEAGDIITPWYDPMIAKVITYGETREVALAEMRKALDNTHVAGSVTNRAFLAALANDENFSAGKVDTGLIARDIDKLTEAETISETVLALAAINLLNIDPTAVYSGWRNWGPAEHLVKLILEDEVYERRLSLHGKGEVSLSGGEGMVILHDIRQSSDEISARTGETKALVNASLIRWSDPKGQKCSLQIDGQTFEITLADPLSAAALDGEGGDAIIAPMTGVIQELKVATGDSVAKGDVLIVMEAMKMLTILSAHRDAVIDSISCTPGQTVSDGDILLTFEPEDK